MAAKCPYRSQRGVGDGPAKCTWFPGTEEQSPHPHVPFTPEPLICDSILDHVGNTPLVRLNSVTKGLKCEVLAKCEFFNAGGSVKDRIGKVKHVKVYSIIYSKFVQEDGS